MGGGNSDNDGSGGEASGGGNIVYAELHRTCRRVGSGDRRRHPALPGGCLETLLRYEAACTSRRTSPRPGAGQAQDVGVHVARRRPVPGRDADGRGSSGRRAAACAGCQDRSIVQSRRGVSGEGRRRCESDHGGADVLLPLRMASPNTGILAPKAYEGSQIDIQGTCTGPFTVVDEAARQSALARAQRELLGRGCRRGDGRGPVHRRRSHPGDSAAEAASAIPGFFPLVARGRLQHPGGFSPGAACRSSTTHVRRSTIRWCARRCSTPSISR